MNPLILSLISRTWGSGVSLTAADCDLIYLHFNGPRETAPLLAALATVGLLDAYNEAGCPQFDCFRHWWRKARNLTARPSIL